MDCLHKNVVIWFILLEIYRVIHDSSIKTQDVIADVIAMRKVYINMDPIRSGYRARLFFHFNYAIYRELRTSLFVSRGILL